MTTHKTGTREEWLAARLELLDTEKEQSPTARISEPVAARLAPHAHPMVKSRPRHVAPALDSDVTIRARRRGGSCRL